MSCKGNFIIMVMFKVHSVILNIGISNTMSNVVNYINDRGHSLILRIRELLKAHIGHDMPTLNDIASRLYMSSQTLRRHLATVGANFQKLKNDLRCDVAMDLLKLPELSIEEVSEKIGFSEQSTFYRAFKKWTGTTPGAYRTTYLAA
jgi:AraC-like DNA-binding protein